MEKKFVDIMTADKIDSEYLNQAEMLKQPVSLDFFGEESASISNTNNAVHQREQLKELMVKNILNDQMIAYRQKYGYDMDGKQKRRTRKNIEKLIAKGKIKMPDEINLNA